MYGLDWFLKSNFSYLVIQLYPYLIACLYISCFTAHSLFQYFKKLDQFIQHHNLIYPLA